MTLLSILYSILNRMGNRMEPYSNLQLNSHGVEQKSPQWHALELVLKTGVELPSYSVSLSHSTELFQEDSIIKGIKSPSGESTEGPGESTESMGSPSLTWSK